VSLKSDKDGVVVERQNDSGKTFDTECNLTTENDKSEYCKTIVDEDKAAKLIELQSIKGMHLVDSTAKQASFHILLSFLMMITTSVFLVVLFHSNTLNRSLILNFRVCNGYSKEM
jgi:hypothetical protein